MIATSPPEVFDRVLAGSAEGRDCFVRSCTATGTPIGGHPFDDSAAAGHPPMNERQALPDPSP
jgi:hypothetical protein